MSLQKKAKSALFEECEIKELSDLFIFWTGNRLGADKRVLLESRILKRLHETKLSPSDYLKEIKNNEIERKNFISALTTHKTDWFREAVHLKFLTEIVKAEGRWNCENPLSIWSAACSTGEEVYSICLALLDENFDQFRVLGTDISEECVVKARVGIYSKEQIQEQVSDQIKKRYFLRRVDRSKNGFYRISPDVQKFAKFRTFNLLKSDLPAQVKFDFIFLRNVLIYFSAETISQVVGRLTCYLKDGGFLIVGLSENIPSPESMGLTQIGTSIYRYDK